MSGFVALPVGRQGPNYFLLLQNEHYLGHQLSGKVDIFCCLWLVPCEYPHFDVSLFETLDGFKDTVLEPVFSGSLPLEILFYLLIHLVRDLTLVLKKDTGRLVLHITPVGYPCLLFCRPGTACSQFPFQRN